MSRPTSGTASHPVIARDLASLRSAIAEARGDSTGTVGFVPTMGSLHAGHRTLVEQSRGRDAVTVVSIFVNPSQFNNEDDLARYPRDEARDVALLAEAGVQVVYAPTPEVMYADDHRTWISVEGLTDELEGAFRPGHFRGVATVVTLLLRMVQPDHAYFGEKDWQQLLVVRQLARDLHLGTEIIPVPTVRDADGLALSSRNVRLSAEARAAALTIPAAIEQTQALYAAGMRDTHLLENRLRTRLVDEPALDIEYAVVLDADTLQHVPQLEAPARVLVAATVDGVRLIDNGALG
jgi:pantoate--beta-alanine ligase